MSKHVFLSENKIDKIMLGILIKERFPDAQINFFDDRIVAFTMFGTITCRLLSNNRMEVQSKIPESELIMLLKPMGMVKIR